MRVRSIRLLVLCALWMSACLSTRLVELANVDVPLPGPDASTGWQGEMRALLARYESAPVLAPEDPRIQPLFGGLTTLSFFGADAEPRVRDQQLAPGSAEGQSLASACGAGGDAEPEDPSYVHVWMPVALHGGPAPAATSCDAHGHANQPDSFCVFARLALRAQPAPLIMVVHGLFDSSAQAYVQQTAAALYRLGFSVLLPDMRDHGDTWRAAPQVATTLGTVEGTDLLTLAQLARGACAQRVTRVGIAGISGGGLDAIRAFSADTHAQLDAGVLALSPVLDVDAAIRDLSETGDCPIVSAFELKWSDDLLLGAATGVGFLGGAALNDLARGQRVNGALALSGGIGLGVGLLGALAADAWFDGGSDACVSQHAIAGIVQDCLRERWRTLSEPAVRDLLSPTGRRITPAEATLGAYLRERVAYRAKLQGLPFQRYTPSSLASEVRRALGSGARPDARLLVIGAEDDPMTRSPGLQALIAHTHGIRQVYAHMVQHGGHASLWVVQPHIMRALFQRFFAPNAQGGQ